MKKFLSITSLLALLSACGGGSEPIDYAQEYANLAGEGQVLISSFENTDVTDLTSVPSSGTFT